jgi:hypothetical protein
LLEILPFFPPLLDCSLRNETVFARRLLAIQSSPAEDRPWSRHLLAEQYLWLAEMTRWTAEEHQLLAILKDRLKTELASSPQYPEVVGERKLVRFLRGHNHDLEKVYGLMKAFLQWRIDHDINEIRKNIVENGCDHPLRFPKGETILKLIPQHVVLPEAQDKVGSPICVEQYNFVPSDVFQFINIDDYIEFVKYSLEYRSLIVEQLSEQRERDFLAKLTPEEREALEQPGSKPYGVLVNTCVVRDLSKFVLILA